MYNLHFTNTWFEEELSHPKSDIKSYAVAHPMHIQLEFLSFLFTNEGETVLLTHNPEPEYENRLRKLGLQPSSYVLLDHCDVPTGQISSWGASLCLQKWAHRHNYNYHIPDWPIVQKANSKEFSFSTTPLLPGSRLLYNEKEALDWWTYTTGPKVLKSVYGVSGRGHFLAEQSHPLSLALPFMQRQWEHHVPVLAETWMKRVMDFSTQWEIFQDKSYQYLGATLCENNVRGMYVRSHAGPEELLFHSYLSFLKEHIKIAENAVKSLQSLGYFGNVGFDAMVYKNQDDTISLHPIVEINARKTMGYVALRLQKKLCPQHHLSLSYQKQDENHNLLPNFVLDQRQKQLRFPKQLTFQISHT